MPAKSTTLRVVGYGRVSKLGSRRVEDDSTQTLKIQREKVSGLAAYKGWQVVAWMEDTNASGGNTERPNFQRALAMIEAGEADVFACAFLDRFSRDLVDTIETERRIREAGGVLVVGDVNIDTSTPIGRLVFTILAAMNQQFLEAKAEAFAETRTRAVERGISPAPAPMGYRQGADRRFVIVEEEAEAIRLAFNLRAEGASCPAIARELRSRGYLSRRGGRFTERLVRSLLEVTTYTGDVVDGANVHRDAHPAIVSRETWSKAQTPSRPRALDSTPALLAGVARCASCSYSLVVAGTRKDGLLYYRCRREHSSGRCPNPASISMEVLDAHVEAAFLTTADAHLTVGFDLGGDADVEAEVEAAQIELDAFLEGASVTVLGAERYNREAGKRTARLDAAMDARRRSQRSALPHIGYGEVSDIWPTLETADKREVLHASLDAVFVKAAPRSHASDTTGRVHIAPVGSVEVTLPRRGVLGTVAPFEFPGDGAGDPVGVLAA